MRWRTTVPIVVTLALALVSTVPAAAAMPPGFSANSKASVQGGSGWNEPAGVTGADNARYVSFQAPSRVSRATRASNWSETGFTAYDNAKPDGDLGDVTMAADRSGAVFLSHLTQNLQADIDYTRDGGATWQTAFNVAQLPFNPSAQPLAVDRPWIAAYSPDTNFLHTRVYLQYHDFVASTVWVVPCSVAFNATSGVDELKCGAPESSSNVQTACNSIPGGIAVAPPGSPHAGRVYSVWSTADPQTNATSGCNITQLAPFYRIYSAWSDNADAGPAATWHQSPVYIGPVNDPKCPQTAPVSGVSTATCADVSELFTPVAIDRAGNAYVAFVDYIDTLHAAYDVYLEVSMDGGTTWNGKADGSGLPFRVNHQTGTHFFPTVAAGDAGRVAIGYVATSYVDRPYQAGDTCPTQVPPMTSCQGKAMPEPPSTAWQVFVAESTNATTTSPSFSEVRVSDPKVIIHYGDVCNLGIYCSGDQKGNRSLLDDNIVFIDGAGFVTYAWTDQREDPTLLADASGSNADSNQRKWDQVYTACQTSGPSLYAKPNLALRTCQ